MSVKKSVMIGAISGLLIATMAVFCARLNNAWDNEALRGIINFIAGVPTLLLSIWMDLPLALQKILFFVYWTVTGALFSLLLSRKKSFLKTICIIIALVSFVVAHRTVQVSLQTQLKDALQGLEALFTGKAYLEEVGK